MSNLNRQTVIALSGVGKTYQAGEVSLAVLQNISFTVGAGEYIAIMGPSGSGKSTLMHILGCLDQPSIGRYELDGAEVTRLSDERLSEIRNAKIGFVFQNFYLLPRMNARQNVEVPLVYRGLHARIRKRIASDLLERLGLADRTQHRPNQLSGGQKQRVAIARALVNGPSIILADEPTGNLDSKTGKEIMGIFTQLNQEGKTIILVTHDEELAHYASRVITILDGQIQGDRPVRSLA